MSEQVSVTIERDLCISCASCYDLCPEVFEENEDDFFSQIVSQYQVDGDPGRGLVTEDMRDCVEEAADSCPVDIIAVE